MAHTGNARFTEVALDQASGCITFVADPAISSSYSIQFPATQGASEQAMLNDGSGNLSWSDVNTTVFGKEYNYAESESVTTTTSTTFIEKLKMTTTSLEGGTYRIGWSFQWNFNIASNDFLAQVEIDDSTNIMDQQQEPKDAAGTFGSTGTNQKYQLSGFKHIVLGSGVHTVDIDWASNDGTNASIWNARLELWRVS